MLDKTREDLKAIVVHFLSTEYRMHKEFKPVVSKHVLSVASDDVRIGGKLDISPCLLKHL